jgi:hypothetical protein
MEYNKISSHRLMRWTPLMTWLLVAFMYEAGGKLTERWTDFAPKDGNLH